MSEEITESNLKLSVTYSRSVSDGNYGSIKAEAWVQGDIASDAAPAAVTEKATMLLQTASVAVWDQLGISYHVDELTGLLVEDTPTPKAQVQSSLGSSGGGSGNGGGGSSGGVRVMNAGDQQGDLPQWLINACNKDGITAVWDNRSKASGNQPLFKEAVPRGATGHGKDGEPKAFWAPK